MRKLFWVVMAFAAACGGVKDGDRPSVDAGLVGEAEAEAEAESEGSRLDAGAREDGPVCACSSSCCMTTANCIKGEVCGSDHCCKQQPVPDAGAGTGLCAPTDCALGGPVMTEGGGICWCSECTSGNGVCCANACDVCPEACVSPTRDGGSVVDSGTPDAGSHPDAMPDATPDAPGEICGNSVCGAGETCTNCPADCGICPPVCGDGICGVGETTDTCLVDCPAPRTGYIIRVVTGGIQANARYSSDASCAIFVGSRIDGASGFSFERGTVEPITTDPAGSYYSLPLAVSAFTPAGLYRLTWVADASCVPSEYGGTAPVPSGAVWANYGYPDDAARATFRALSDEAQSFVCWYRDATRVASDPTAHCPMGIIVRLHSDGTITGAGAEFCSDPTVYGFPPHDAECADIWPPT